MNWPENEKRWVLAACWSWKRCRPLLEDIHPVTELLAVGRGLRMEADRRRLNLWVEAGILLAGLWERRNHSHGSLSFVCVPLPVNFVHARLWAADS